MSYQEELKFLGVGCSKLQREFIVPLGVGEDALDHEAISCFAGGICALCEETCDKYERLVNLSLVPATGRETLIPIET